MMWYKFLVLVVISFFTFSLRVDAALCDKEHVNRLKELANQVEVSYEYIDNSDSEEEEFITNTYSILVSLVSDELYINNGYNDYYHEQASSGTINFFMNSGKARLTVHSKVCAGIKLRTIDLTLPKFNTYSYRQECKQVKEYNLDVCDPWYQGYVDDNTFRNIVAKYLNKEDVDDNSILNKIFKFLGNYYLFILGGVVLIVSVILFRIVHRRRSVLE